MLHSTDMGLSTDDIGLAASLTDAGVDVSLTDEAISPQHSRIITRISVIHAENGCNIFHWSNLVFPKIFTN